MWRALQQLQLQQQQQLLQLPPVHAFLNASSSVSCFR